jgi:Protein of unknown function (DUF3383)
MPKLPFSRTVNVTLTRRENFSSKRGFGVPLLLSHVAVAGKVDATLRTKVYGSIDEIVADHASSTEVYKAALAAFSQNPRPVQIKVGYINFVPATGTAADLRTQLDLIHEYDADWYWIGIVKELRDRASLDGLASWVQAKNKQAIIDSNDVGHETIGNTTCISARLKNTVDRTSVFYLTSDTEYAGFALAALLGTFNFDQIDSAYTAKYKKLAGVVPLNKGSAVVQAVTGFTPALGQSITAGHMANTYVDIGGLFFVVEGSTLTPNVFIDEVHATDWIIARTEEETLSLLANNKRIPYTDAGLELLASGARIVMRQAERAGLIADDIDPLTGKYAPAIVYTIPGAFSVPESQRKSRVAPEIGIRFRYAGAIHYTTINYRLTY